MSRKQMSTKKQVIRTYLQELSNPSVLKYASTDLHFVKFIDKIYLSHPFNTMADACREEQAHNKY